MEGRSTETALHMGEIEISISVRGYSPVAFLNIEGTWSQIEVTSALTCLCVEVYMISFKCQMSRYRVVRSEMPALGYISGGTPQSGVLSLLLWVLIVNQLL